jgi:acetyl/propionyl-CoA carboxylase alpha subunit
MEPDTDLRTEYDPLLAKLMVHADDRPAAVARLRRALDETLIGGVQTDGGFLRWLVDDAAFSSGRYDTSLIADRWGAGHALSDDIRELVARAAVAGRARSGIAAATAASSPRTSAWGRRAREEALRR